MTVRHCIAALLFSILWIGVSAKPPLLVAQGIEQDPPTQPDTGFTPDWDWSVEKFMANEVIYAFGGQKKWKDKSWNIAFDVVAIVNKKEVERYSYQWNRSTGQCIASGKIPDGRPWQVNFSDVTARTGTATVGGKPVLRSELPGILQMTANRFNDHLRSILLPFFLLDSGVVLMMGSDTTLPSEHSSPGELGGGMPGGGTMQGGAMPGGGTMQGGGMPDGGMPDGGMPGGGMPGGGMPGGGRQGKITALIAEFTQDSLQPSLYTLYLDNNREVKAVKSERGDQELFLWWDKTKRFGDIRLLIPIRQQTLDRSVTFQYENINVGKFEIKADG